jgi:hypothetical protein
MTEMGKLATWQLVPSLLAVGLALPASSMISASPSHLYLLIYQYNARSTAALSSNCRLGADPLTGARPSQFSPTADDHEVIPKSNGKVKLQAN